MSSINELLTRRDEVLAKIKDIEEKCEGINNENNAKRLSELNMQQAKLSAEKSLLAGKIHSLEKEINRISEEILGLSGIGIEKILKAIKKQRWFFFKNKPKVLMDRDTGILWANLDYFKYFKEGGATYSAAEASSIVKSLIIDDLGGWKIPNPFELWEMIYDKTFTFQEGDKWRIKNFDRWYVIYDNKPMGKDLDDNGATNDIVGGNTYLIPCNSSLTTENYKSNISATNKIYTETERLQFTLNLFINNKLEPIFKDNEVTTLYKKIYFEKPQLIEKLNELQEQINSLQQVVLLSSTFDYQSILVNYNHQEIEHSIIKYHEAVTSVMDELMDKLHYYEDVKNEIIRDFHVIGLKLSKKYDDNPNFTDEENTLFKNRQDFFKKHFELGMNMVYTKLLAIKKQAEAIEERIEFINNGDQSIKELAILEKEERASFGFIVENAANIIRNALVKIEFFEENRKFATNVVALWNLWNEDYKVFKTTLKDDLKNICEDDGIESEVYLAWYQDWQKKRFMIEERFLPLIEYGLKGNLIDGSEHEQTAIEHVIALLQGYKDGIDKFFIEERKSIHTKCFFQIGGDLQEKFETESELFKLGYQFQKNLQEIIFSLEKGEDRLFLLKWADRLLDIQVDEVLDFVKDKELSKISNEVLTEFADLKRQNFDVYISDSKAYSEELQRREKEYNSLIFKMRKDLVKQ